MAFLYMKQKGDFKHTETYLNKLLKLDYISVINKYGEKGVEALKNATPKDTGKTAESWYYKIVENKNKGTIKLVFSNSNTIKGIPVAILIYYGHGTRNGGYVQGRDYINPVLQPLFDQMAKDIFKEVKAK